MLLTSLRLARRRPLALACSALLALLLPATGCRRSPTPSARPPLLVIGVDGAEWKVVRRLWADGKLPHLRTLADRGVSATLKTAYNSSPVIWTTIATGVRPDRHGITDFVVATPAGDVPVSSSVRKVPALWNMASRAQRKVALLGWWASWPAEEVNGLVLSDRLLLPLPNRFYPASYGSELDRTLRERETQACGFRAEGAERQDQTMARTAVRLGGAGYDLTLLYFRSLDIVSHHSWKGFEPEAFPRASAADLEPARGEVERIYTAVDCAIGRVMERAPREANVVVLSDHGFHATREEEVRPSIDFDAVLAELGYLRRKGSAVDFARSRVFTYASAPFRRTKMLRFALAGREPGGTVRAEEREAIAKRLEADLAGVTNEQGEPVFSLRAARPKRHEDGDLAVIVSQRRVSSILLLRGKPIQGAVLEISRLSGTHSTSTDGIFLAAGPDIDRQARLSGIHVHDMAPTFLYGLGLPVARDFAGRAWTALFTEAFRRRNPLRTIATWGTRGGESGASRSPGDEKLLEDLRSLGYIQ